MQDDDNINKSASLAWSRRFHLLLAEQVDLEYAMIVSSYLRTNITPKSAADLPSLVVFAIARIWV